MQNPVERTFQILNITKIDIMDKGSDARDMLLNLEIPLTLGKYFNYCITLACTCLLTEHGFTCHCAVNVRSLNLNDSRLHSSPFPSIEDVVHLLLAFRVSIRRARSSFKPLVGVVVARYVHLDFREGVRLRWRGLQSRRCCAA